MEDFIEYYNQGLNDRQIAEKLNVCRETIRNKRLKLNLPVNKNNKIDKNVLIDYVNKGYKDSEIATILGVKEISIYFSRRRNKIIRESFAISKPRELSDIQKQVIVGCLLGDGYMGIKESINPYFKCEHGLKQKQYAEHKSNLLESLISFTKYYKRPKADKRNGIFYESYSTIVNANPCFLWFYNQFYTNKKKRITKEVLEFYTPLAMAIHYMDDGYLTSSNKTFGIATNSFDIESINNLQEKLLQYGIKTTLHSKNQLYIKRSSALLFKSLIEPYVIESMKYKIKLDEKPKSK